nr:spore coat U domain-containing protein [Microbulbifer rhizosphaerae]
MLFSCAGTAWGQTCTYTVEPTVDFGSITGLPTPQIDVSADITVTCPAMDPPGERRVCISLPVGSGGVSFADRRMVNGGFDVQYQLYRNAGRTLVWGNVAGGQERILLFPLVGGTRVATVFGRVFSGQTGKSVGLYQSVLSGIEVREGTPMQLCSAITNIFILPDTITAQLDIQPDCTISANPLNFGTVNSVGVQDASSNLSVTCTLNGAYTIALDGGTTTGDVNDRKMQLGTDTIDYQLYSDAARTQVWGDTAGTTVDGTGSGDPQSIPVFGRVPAQGPKPEGTYQDTITATVTF